MLLPRTRHGYLRKARLRDNDRIPIAHRYFRHELFALVFLQVLLICYQELCRGIQRPELVRHLLHEMVRHHDHGLLCKSVLPQLHCRRRHRKALAAPDDVVQKRTVPRSRDARHRILLVRAELDCRVHAGEFQIAPVIAWQSNLIEQTVVRFFQIFPALRIGVYPVRERFFDFILLFPRRYRFRLIEYLLFPSVLQYRIVNGRRALVQTVLKQTERVCPARAVFLRCVHARVLADVFRTLNLPRTVERIVAYLQAVLIKPINIQQLH